ncbi:hypothetical protein DC3_42260 [Deinococcus cellulosilyticus NBRC 106333 = KACC 11606]|uniref:Tetratricopeptide repeat protein n=1 Tax=Deinococcus cellulosilyticus (strain DSM 18568 / NBRC 106333 / KACC 11606 / 5516J-15) TaxID=1223518 RepID=A0A511N836_DEIC1|nr:hypothetical protein DC3_42260 [Deinococcus cellulosilyticus NBRC 106333 = KACC 11606]
MNPVKWFPAVVILTLGVASAATLSDVKKSLAAGQVQQTVQNALEIRTSEAYTLAAEALVLSVRKHILEKSNAPLLEQAETYARKAIELDPQNAAAYYQLSKALGGQAVLKGALGGLGALGETRELFEKSVQLNPNYAPGQVGLAMWHANVIKYGTLTAGLYGGKEQEILPRLQKAVDLEPHVVSHELNYAKALIILANKNKRLKSKYLQDARKHLQKATQMPAPTYWDREDREEAVGLLRSL